MAEPIGGPALMTAEEFALLRDDTMRHELIRGVVRGMPFNDLRHGAVGAMLGMYLGRWADEQDVADVAACVGFIIERDPDTVRAPDLAVMARDRAPITSPSDYPEEMPDLAVEVVSVTDTPAEVLEKTGCWLQAGVRQVWVAWPKSQRLQVWRSADDITTFGVDDTIVADGLLAGLEVPLARVFK